MDMKSTLAVDCTRDLRLRTLEMMDARASITQRATMGSTVGTGEENSTDKINDLREEEKNKVSSIDVSEMNDAESPPR
jgi:hypothetical protein